MDAYLDDGDVRLFVGDAREVLAQLPEGSVHAVMCSPPFFSLRDYGTGKWEGGDPACDHLESSRERTAASTASSGLQGSKATVHLSHAYKAECQRCGAVRVDSQIGLEATPAAYTDALVAVFREARRVLRDDGTLWIEIGDSYSSSRGAHPGDGARPQARATAYPVRPVTDLPGKNLYGIPWRVAFALQDDGWWLRGAYIWVKPDAMPESVRDRCTTSHSYVFHLSKRSRYFFDRYAILEPFSDYSTGGDGGSYGANADGHRPPTGGPRRSGTYVRNRGGVADGQVTLDGGEPEVELVGPDGRRAMRVTAGHNSEQHRDGDRWPSLEGRSPRSVWRIPTEANSFGICPSCRRYWPDRAPERHCGVDVVAHFAVWPHDLVGKIIACSTSEAGCCADCGAPRARAVRSERFDRAEDRVYGGAASVGGSNPAGRVPGSNTRGMPDPEPEHLGWEPTCECAAPTVPCVVLDPFAGSGTTGRQARRMGRHAVLIELSLDYAEIAAHRLGQQALDLVAG